MTDLQTRLLIATSTFPESPHGVQPRFVLDLALGLRAHFAEVHALAPDYPAAEPETVMEGVRVHRATYWRPRSWQRLCYGQGILDNVRRCPPLLVQSLPYIAVMRRRMAEIVREHDCRIVNTHWFIPQGLAGALARKDADFRHVVHVHGAGIHVLRRLPGPLGRGVARFVASRTDRFVCDSAHVRAQLDGLLGRETAAAVSPAGVRADLLHRKRPARKPGISEILFVGRLVEKKGVDYLLRALPAVRAAIPGARLRVAGGGRLLPRLKALASNLSLSANEVTFLGPLPHEHVLALLDQADLVVVPSVADSHGETDGMPTVVLEAMATTGRVVGSREDGIPEIVVDGENGWLCPPGDSDALARRITEALRDTSPTIPEAARLTVEKYTWERVCARYAEFLK